MTNTPASDKDENTLEYQVNDIITNAIVEAVEQYDVDGVFAPRVSFDATQSVLALYADKPQIPALPAQVEVDPEISQLINDNLFELIDDAPQPAVAGGDTWLSDLLRSMATRCSIDEKNIAQASNSAEQNTYIKRYDRVIAQTEQAITKNYRSVAAIEAAIERLLGDKYTSEYLADYQQEHNEKIDFTVGILRRELNIGGE